VGAAGPSAHPTDTSCPALAFSARSAAARVSPSSQTRAGPSSQGARTTAGSHLPVRRTLRHLGIPPATFYRWCDLYQAGGLEALEDRPSRPGRVWSRIPDAVRGRILDLALHPRCGSMECPRNGLLWSARPSESCNKVPRQVRYRTKVCR
jgi:hypothetical protein